MKFTKLMPHADMGGVEAIMRQIDVDGDGTADLYEFAMFIMNQMATVAGSAKRFHHDKVDDDDNRMKGVGYGIRKTKPGHAEDAFYSVPASPAGAKVQWSRDGKLKMAKKYKQLKLTDKAALEAVREMAVQNNRD